MSSYFEIILWLVVGEAVGATVGFAVATLRDVAAGYTPNNANGHRLLLVLSHGFAGLGVAGAILFLLSFVRAA